MWVPVPDWHVHTRRTTELLALALLGSIGNGALECPSGGLGGNLTKGSIVHSNAGILVWVWPIQAGVERNKISGRPPPLPIASPHQPPPSADSHSRPPIMHTRLSFPLLVADFCPISILLNPFLPPHVFSLPSFPFCRCFELGNPSYPRASFEKNLSSFIQTILRICYLLSRNMTNQISLHFSAFLCITLHFTF